MRFHAHILFSLVHMNIFDKHKTWGGGTYIGRWYSDVPRGCPAIKITGPVLRPHLAPENHLFKPFSSSRDPTFIFSWDKNFSKNSFRRPVRGPQFQTQKISTGARGALTWKGVRGCAALKAPFSRLSCRSQAPSWGATSFTRPPFQRKG